MVPAVSSRISPVPPYSGYPNSCKPYQYRTITFYGPTFQLCSHSVYIHISGPTTPYRYFGTVWAPPLSLATTHGILSFPPGTEMFQFPEFPAHGLCVQPWLTWHSPSRVSPFGHRWLTALARLPIAFRSATRPSSALDA